MLPSASPWFHVPWVGEAGGGLIGPKFGSGCSSDAMTHPGCNELDRSPANTLIVHGITSPTGQQDMASVRKRVRDGRTTWLADYFDQQGKRHNKTFLRERDAKMWLAQAQVEIKEGTHTPSTASITVAEAGKQWLAQGERDGLERSTLAGYRQHLELHIAPYIGRVKPAELLPSHVQYLRD